MLAYDYGTEMRGWEYVQEIRRLRHLYTMYRFLLFCHNKRPSYELDFTIEEPFSYIFTEKVSHRLFQESTVRVIQMFLIT